MMVEIRGVTYLFCWFGHIRKKFVTLFEVAGHKTGVTLAIVDKIVSFLKKASLQQKQ